MEEDPRAALDAVAQALRPLHKSLLEVTRADYEREHGPIPGPGVFFQLLVRDPFFAWLRPMSGLMAQIDEILDEEEPPAPARVAELCVRVEELVTESDHPFSARYLQILQTDPDVVMAHAALRRALGGHAPPSKGA
jgi:hypothetical protein